MDLPKRKQIRLPDYDYSSPGAYFVTICTKDRRCILSDIAVGAAICRPSELRLTAYGEIVECAIKRIPDIYPSVLIDDYVIMPNHVHLILRICTDNNGRQIAAPTATGTNRRQVAAPTAGPGTDGRQVAAPTATGTNGRQVAAPTEGLATDGRQIAAPTAGSGTNGRQVAAPTAGSATDGRQIAAPTAGSGTDGRQVAAPTLSSVIGQMKRWASIQAKMAFWQKSFHEHVIRSEDDYLEIRNYIESNPAKWTEDRYFTE